MPKSWVHQAIFSVLEVKRSKILQKLNKRDCPFIFLVSFFMAFLAQKLIYTINIWFNFVFGSFFEQDHLLNLITLRVYAKRWPERARISKQKLMQPKIWLMICFLTLTVRRPFCRKDFKWKKYEGTGFISAKKEGFYTELNERVEAVTRIYSETGNFYNIFILCLRLRIIRKSNLGV